MNDDRVNQIANRIAADNESDPALEEVDKAIDAILLSIQAIEEELPKVAASTPAEREAKEKIANLFETAINPYFADVMESMQVFGGEDKPE